MMSYRLDPDLALVTDVTHATDSPGIDQKEHGTVKLSHGPSIQHGGANHPSLVRYLEDVATKHTIQVQHEATSVRTGPIPIVFSTKNRYTFRFNFSAFAIHAFPG